MSALQALVAWIGGSENVRDVLFTTWQIVGLIWTFATVAISLARWWTAAREATLKAKLDALR